MNNPWNFLADSSIPKQVEIGFQVKTSVLLFPYIPRFYIFSYVGLDEGEAASQYAFNTREREGGTSLFGLKAYVPYLHRC